jgi:hypothetical protein
MKLAVHNEIYTWNHEEEQFRTDKAIYHKLITTWPCFALIKMHHQNEKKIHRNQG